MDAGNVIEFDGPANFHCLGVKYVILSHGGVKGEAEPYPGGMCDTPEDAWTKFGAQLAEYTRDAQQIAWRRKAELSTLEGKFAVSARLARFPEDA